MQRSGLSGSVLSDSSSIALVIELQSQPCPFLSIYRNRVYSSGEQWRDEKTKGVVDEVTAIQIEASIAAVVEVLEEVVGGAGDAGPQTTQLDTQTIGISQSITRIPVCPNLSRTALKLHRQRRPWRTQVR